MASPGMLQSGISRQLFDMWCQDEKNACVVAGYCVEGTLAKFILTEPKEVTLMVRACPWVRPLCASRVPFSHES